MIAEKSLKGHPLLVLAATILGSSIAYIDSTVVNVIMPVLQKDLSATAAETQWIVESYLLFLTSLLLVGGNLGDLFGRRRIFALGIFIFGVSSFLCGFVEDSLHLIFWRALKGVGGALLVPGSLAILSAHFQGADRGKAIGTWSAFSAMTTAIGPLLGGWLADNLSWRWAFWINVPLCLIVIALLFIGVKESKNLELKGKIDFPGTFLITLSLGGLIFGLTEFSRLGYQHPLVISSLLCAVVSFIAFLYVESKVSYPMVPLKLFQSRIFSVMNLLTFLLYGILSGLLFFLPFNLIHIQGYTATQAGASFLPISISLFILSRYSGDLSVRFGLKMLLIPGLILTSAGLWCFSFPGVGGSYWVTFFPAILLFSLGLSAIVAPLTNAVMSSVSTEFSGTASGINNAVARGAGLAGIALLGIFLYLGFQVPFQEGLASLPLSPEQLTEIALESQKLTAMEIPKSLTPLQQEQLRTTVNLSYIEGFRLISQISSLVLLSGAIFVFFFIKKEKGQ